MIYKIDAVFRNAQKAIEQEFNDLARTKAYEIQGIIKKLNAIIGEDAVSVQFYAESSHEESDAYTYYWDSCVNQHSVPLDCVDNFFEVLTGAGGFINLDIVEGCDDLINQLYKAMKTFENIDAPGINNKIEVSEGNILISIEACINGRRY